MIGGGGVGEGRLYFRALVGFRDSETVLRYHNFSIEELFT